MNSTSQTSEPTSEPIPEKLKDGPTYAVSTNLFLRLLGLVYLIAFWSFLVQSDGLLGDRGILPVAEFFSAVRDALGADAIWKLPSLVWLHPSGGTLIAFAAIGCALSLCVMAGFAVPVALALNWVLYLSLVLAGQVFYSFQWDILLLEAGFLAIFLSPWAIRPRAFRGHPHPAARFLVIWLLFRLMFASGLVKLTSGDPTWTDWSALDFHYFTQPIPNPFAWILNQMPPWFQTLSLGLMFFIELAIPFLCFGPRIARLIACACLVGLQILIEATGNYGFFNLLTASLAILLIDDRSWGRGFRAFFAARDRARGFPAWCVWPLAAAITVISLVPLWSALRKPLPDILEPLAKAYDTVAPFRSINGYGLFSVMTKDRPEIIVQGTSDGIHWKSYTFKYKPGPVDRMPPFIAPYMPRLDWQMWFAALGTIDQNPWFVAFLHSLLEAEPDVLALLADDPFDGERPLAVRANLDEYTFTTWSGLQESGAWWTAEPRSIYVGEVTLRAFQ